MHPEAKFLATPLIGIKSVFKIIKVSCDWEKCSVISMASFGHKMAVHIIKKLLQFVEKLIIKDNMDTMKK